MNSGTGEVFVSAVKIWNELLISLRTGCIGPISPTQHIFLSASVASLP